MGLHCYDRSGATHTVGVFNLYDRLFLMEQSFNSFTSGFHLVSVTASFAGGFDKCKFRMKIFVLPELFTRVEFLCQVLEIRRHARAVVGKFFKRK